MGTSMEPSCTLTKVYDTTPTAAFRFKNTLRAGKMAMPPLVCTFSFEVGKNIQLRLPFFLNSFKQILNALMKSQVEMN